MMKLTVCVLTRYDYVPCCVSAVSDQYSAIGLADKVHRAVENVVAVEEQL